MVQGDVSRELPPLLFPSAWGGREIDMGLGCLDKLSGCKLLGKQLGRREIEGRTDPSSLQATSREKVFPLRIWIGNKEE